MEMDMVLLLMMMILILMMPMTMVMTMSTISPSGRCSPRRNLPARDGFFFSIGFHYGAAGKLRVPSLFRYFSRGDDIGQREAPGVGPGPQEASRRALGGRAQGAPGPLVAPLWPPFGLLP